MAQQLSPTSSEKHDHLQIKTDENLDQVQSTSNVRVVTDYSETPSYPYLDENLRTTTEKII